MSSSLLQALFCPRPFLRIVTTSRMTDARTGPLLFSTERHDVLPERRGCTSTALVGR